LKATLLIFALAGILAVGSYGYHLYTLFRDWRFNMPQPQIEKLTRDLRIFHAKQNRFPETFNEINDLIWHTKPTPDYGPDGRQARTKNYYYFNTRVDDHKCAMWALPIGPRRHYASSFFLVLSQGWLRSWKGKAIEDEMINRLPAVLNPDQLSGLKMHELPARTLTK
jgi:hypothetical protein